jgi:hypothetical protein
MPRRLPDRQPIEAYFAALFAATRNRLLAEGSARYALTLCPQVWVEAPHDRRYRLDFALKPLDEWLARALTDAHLEMRIGLELDGQAFHERTPQQVIVRNQRDRDLAALDWRILHFSGSELHRDAGGVVVEALEAGATALDAAKAALLPSKGQLTVAESHLVRGGAVERRSRVSPV